MAGYKELLSALPHRRWSIQLATHRGTDIENETSAPSLSLSTLRTREEERLATIGARHRPPTAGYNCFGQVFAVRRTAIYDQKYVDLILMEDGYGEITRDEEAQVGDVVLYSDDRGYNHAARIVRFEKLLTLSGKIVPVVLSKFDDVSGEYEHRIDDLRWSCDQSLNRRTFRDRHVPPQQHPTWRQSLLALEAARAMKD